MKISILISALYKYYYYYYYYYKTIPPDTPSYLRKALERNIKEYNQGIIKDKSALDEFANKYIVKGKSGITPFEFFKSKSTYLKEFLRNHRNIKVRFVLVCLMEKMEKKASDGKLNFTVQDKAYFNSDTHINLESTDVKEILVQVIRTILEKINIYQMNGSGWFLKKFFILKFILLITIQCEDLLKLALHERTAEIEQQKKKKVENYFLEHKLKLYTK